MRSQTKFYLLNHHHAEIKKLQEVVVLWTTGDLNWFVRMAGIHSFKDLDKNLLQNGSATIVFRCLPLQVHVSLGHSVDSQRVWRPRSG